MPRFGPEAIDRLRTLLRDDDGTPPTSEFRSEFRLAAVLVPLFLREDTVHVVLTKRTDNVRTHQGQISFPGGAWEPSDATLRETALRESQEEVGLRPRDVEILGALEDTPTAVSGFIVRPYVAVVPHPYEFVQDVAEVAGLLSPPLEVFADPARRREEIRERDGVRYPLYFFDVEGETVWGATARMLVSLTDRLA